METHSIILAWKIPWIEERDGLLELARVGHDLVTKLPSPPPKTWYKDIHYWFSFCFNFSV